MANKCNSYHLQPTTRYTYHPLTGRPIAHDIEVGVCWGTKECDQCNCDGDMTQCDFYPEVRKRALKRREVKFGEWISVKDRLPEEDTIVLVWCGEVSVFNYLRDDLWHTGYCDITTDEGGITRWMPLPSPLTEKEN